MVSLGLTQTCGCSLPAMAPGAALLLSEQRRVTALLFLARQEQPIHCGNFKMEIWVPLSPKPSGGLQGNRTTLKPFWEEGELLLEITALSAGPNVEHAHSLV